MKAIVLVTGSRGCSDFFQGLLDNHNEILQIPGVLRINTNFFEKIKYINKNNNFFIKQKAGHIIKWKKF